MKDPRNYLRHFNGRGIILGEAEVSKETRLARTAVAKGSSEIRDANIIGYTTIQDNALVLGGTVKDSLIGGSSIISGVPYINNSIINGRMVTGNAILFNAAVTGSAVVADYAVVLGKSLDEPIVITDSARVYGTAKLIGSFTVSGDIRISSGEWNRCPRHLDLGFVSVTESKLGCMVDCCERRVEYWLTHGPKLARRWGWTEREINKALDAVRFVCSK